MNDAIYLYTINSFKKTNVCIKTNVSWLETPFSNDTNILTLFDIYLFQKSCIDFAINATPLERYMPEERVGFKYRLWRIVESTPFEYFIMTLIVLNTILLMMKVRQYINDTMESKPF